MIVIERLQAMSSVERNVYLKRYLQPREADLLNLRYGWGDGVSYQIRDIARILRIDPDAVLHKEKGALSKLARVLGIPGEQDEP